MTLNSNFNRLASLAFIAQAEQIVTAMTGNASFPEPWPSTVPTLQQIQADLAAYQAAATATGAGDRTRIVERQAARSKLQTDLTQLAFQLQTVSQGDATLLATTGYPLRQPAQRSRITEIPSAPDGFVLSRGVLSGSIQVRARRVPKAASYDVQIATADPTLEANWSMAGSFKNCGHIELEGLTPGKIYSVRMRALGSAGPGAWTAPSSLMVV